MDAPQIEAMMDPMRILGRRLKRLSLLTSAETLDVIFTLSIISTSICLVIRVKNQA